MRPPPCSRLRPHIRRLVESVPRPLQPPSAGWALVRIGKDLAHKAQVVFPADNIGRGAGGHPGLFARWPDHSDRMAVIHSRFPTAQGDRELRLEEVELGHDLA